MSDESITPSITVWDYFIRDLIESREYRTGTDAQKKIWNNKYARLPDDIKTRLDAKIDEDNVDVDWIILGDFKLAEPSVDREPAVDITYKGNSSPKMNAIINQREVRLAIELHLFDPSSDVSFYDQFFSGIAEHFEKKDAFSLWIIARTVRHFPGLTSGLAKYAASMAILAEHSFATQRMNRPEIFWYNPMKGVYQPHGSVKIKEIIRIRMGDASADIIEEVIGGIRDRTYREKEDFKAPLNLICVKNGVLDIFTGELRPHTPDIIFLSCKNADYDPTKGCPNFKKFLTEVLPDENDQKVIEEWLGYMLHREYIYHVVLLLLGDGRNGKTTLLNVMRDFLGDGNHSAKTMYDLANGSFALFDLYGKDANISGEIGMEGGGLIRSIGLIKNLCGNEIVPMEQKFKDGFQERNTAKLIFATNQLPLTKDETLGNWSRWLLINFNQTFMRGDPKTDELLIHKLTTDDELSGILNLAIRGLKRLLRKHNFTYNKTPDDVKELWTISANPVHAFVNDMIVCDNQGVIEKAILYENFKEYCDEKGVMKFSYRKFNELLKNEIPTLGEAKRGPRDNQKSVWLEIKISSIEAEKGNNDEHQDDLKKFVDTENSLLASDGSPVYTTDPPYTPYTQSSTSYRASDEKENQTSFNKKSKKYNVWEVIDAIAGYRDTDVSQSEKNGIHELLDLTEKEIEMMKSDKKIVLECLDRLQNSCKEEIWAKEIRTSAEEIWTSAVEIMHDALSKQHDAVSKGKIPTEYKGEIPTEYQLPTQYQLFEIMEKRFPNDDMRNFVYEYDSDICQIAFEWMKLEDD